MNELKHYGVIGMRWGIRRYQPYSVKPRLSGEKGIEIGKAREYAREESKTRKILRKANEKSIKQKNSDNISPATQTLNESKKIVERTSNIAKRSSRKTQTDAKHMTDQELRDAINRMNLEKQYEILVTERDTVDSGREKVYEILDTTGDVLAIGASAAVILATLSQLRKS